MAGGTVVSVAGAGVAPVIGAGVAPEAGGGLGDGYCWLMACYTPMWEKRLHKV